MRYLILFLVVLFGNSFVHAQITDSVIFESSPNSNPIKNEGSSVVDPGTLQKTRSYQSENLSVKKFDKEKWKKIVGATDYNEGQRPVKKRSMRDSTTSQSNGNKGKRAYRTYDEDSEEDLAEPREDSSITISPFVGLLLKIFFYGAVIMIIGFILYAIFKNTTFKSSTKDAKIVTPDFTDHVEDISELDVDSLLKRTLAAGDFRLAIRMYFLGLLKKLNEDGFIVWKKDKTNRDYLNELLARAYYFEEVRRLTLAYEQVWYGDHTLPADSYQQLIAEFKAIDQKLHNTKAP